MTKILCIEDDKNQHQEIVDALLEELRENYPDTRDISSLFLTALDHRTV